MTTSNSLRQRSRATLKAVPGAKPAVRFFRKMVQGWGSKPPCQANLPPGSLRSGLVACDIPVTFREALAEAFIGGAGLEIGALHQPLRVPASAKVRYVDRMDVAGLRAHYPELKPLRLVAVDIIDDGEQLRTVSNGSQDFLIANHFLEHTQNPIGTLRRFLEVLRVGGVLYLAIPDKRGTFDRNRPLTSFEHLLKDDRQGPDWSRYDHFHEFAELVDNATGPDLERETKRLMDMDYSIHFHVWTHATFWELLVKVREQLRLPFMVDVFLFNAALSETICILKKT